MTVKRNRALAKDLNNLLQKEKGLSRKPMSPEDFLNQRSRSEHCTKVLEKTRPKPNAKKVEFYNCKDLLLYFQTKAKNAESYYRGVSKMRDLGAFSHAKKSYTNEELVLMIDFLFDSDQDYIDAKRTGPGILQTNWVTSLLPDAILWREGKYVPKSRKKHVTYGEWQDAPKDDVAKVDDWGE